MEPSTAAPSPHRLSEIVADSRCLSALESIQRAPVNVANNFVVIQIPRFWVHTIDVSVVTKFTLERSHKVISCSSLQVSGLFMIRSNVDSVLVKLLGHREGNQTISHITLRAPRAEAGGKAPALGVEVGAKDPVLGPEIAVASRTLAETPEIGPTIFFFP
jgi:hypothetical protein